MRALAAVIAAGVAVWVGWAWRSFRREVVDLLERILEAVRPDRHRDD